MRVGIVGAGVAGLSAAFHLAREDGVSVTVLDQRDHFGGRAGVDELGEHCPRFFLSDYSALFAILRRIPGHDGRSVYDDLQAVRRFAHSTQGWVEISHLYRFLAKEIPPAEKLRMAWSWRPTPLLAEQRRRHNGNRYGRLRDMSPRPAVRALSNLFRESTGYVMPGSTEDYLISPWVRHLRASDVTLCAGQRVQTVQPAGETVRLKVAGEWAEFDAVVLAAHLPDLVHLLDASWLDHRLVDGGNLHCAAFTLQLDPREPLLAEPRPALYGRNGVNVLVQPAHARAVALCLRAASTDPDFVVRTVRDHLSLVHPVRDVRTTSNHRPGEGLFAGNPVRAERILRRRVGHIYFAGSFLHSSYPIDAAETATRSALAAVRAIRRDLRLGTPTDRERAV